jgi:multiple sugar transport system permease protein
MNGGRGQTVVKWLTAAFLLIFCLVPFVWMLLVSVSQSHDFPAAGTEFTFTLDNYREVVTSESTPLLQYLRNSLLISAIAAFFTTFFASLSAYAITRLRFRGRMLIPLALLAFSMFPQISIVGYLFKFMTWLGWVNTYAALVFPSITLGLPLALWIMLSYFSQLPQELDKAGLIDGAGRFQILRKIILPVALPGAFSTLLLVFIFSFNEFLFALMLTVDQQARTVPVGIALFQGLHGQTHWGEIMAGAVVATLPLIILTVFFQRHIVRGLTQGAVKG